MANWPFEEFITPPARSAVPNIFGTRDWFYGRQFFHGPGWGRWFQDDSSTLHLLTLISCSFHYTDVSFSWLNLFLGKNKKILRRKFIPRYFILFDATVNGIVVLISLFNSSLCNRFFCVDFISHNFAEFISSNSLLTEVLGFSIHNIVSFANSDSFTSFPIETPFTSSLA